MILITSLLYLIYVVTVTSFSGFVAHGDSN